MGVCVGDMIACSKPVEIWDLGFFLLSAARPSFIGLQAHLHSSLWERRTQDGAGLKFMDVC